MLLGTRYVVVHGIEPDVWAQRYDIEPFETSCPDCGALAKSSIPVAVGELRGLMVPPCPCGSRNRAYCLVRDPKYGDLLDGAARHKV